MSPSFKLFFLVQLCTLLSKLTAIITNNCLMSDCRLYKQSKISSRHHHDTGYKAVSDFMIFHIS